MAIGLQQHIVQVESAKQNWDAVRSAIPSGFPMNGVTIEPRHIDRWFDEVIRLLNIAEQQENPDMAMLAIHLPGITSQSQQLVNHATQMRSNPAGLMPNVINMLWGLRSSILWVLPIGATWEGWPAHSAEIQDTFQSMSQTYAEAIKRIEEIKTLKTELNALQGTLPSVKELAADIQKVMQEVTNAKTSAEGSASNAAAKKEEIDEQTKTLVDLVTKQSEQLAYFENKKDVVEKTLAGASAIALGSSFDDQRGAHETGKTFWTKSFYAGLFVMVVVELVAAFYPTYFPSLSNETWMTWLLSRVVIVSPVIWFTWFAALQYSRAMKLSEDYAFKTAAAKSFYGYRKEVGADEELLKLLQETSIKNFGSNPIRLLGNDDHGSPTHEFFEKLASKVDADVLTKFADALKEFAEKKTKGSS